MAISADDIVHITQLVHRYAHIMDSGVFEDLGHVLTADVTLDATDLGDPPCAGLDAYIANAHRAVHPASHLVGTVYVFEENGEVHVMSKPHSVYADGRVTPRNYHDVVVRTDEGWKIAARTLTTSPSRRPG